MASFDLDGKLTVRFIRMLIVLDEWTDNVPCRFGAETAGIDHSGNSIWPYTEYPYFGLSHVVETLRAMPLVFLTLAHRTTDSAPGVIQNAYFGWDSLPDVGNFIDLEKFDVVWLIGSGSPSAGSVSFSESEVAAFTAYMQGGGGLFGVGDHADFGATMCARLPRLGRMRAWTSDQKLPPAMYFPDGGSPTRISTIQYDIAFDGTGGPIPKYGQRSFHPSDDNPLVPGPYVITPLKDAPAWLEPFENQSDDIAAPIKCKSYSIMPGISQVHPVVSMLDGSGLYGLPDHMHEGTCIRNQPNAYWQQTGEFPTSPSGVCPVPEVVATGEALPQGDWTEYTEPYFFSDYVHPAPPSPGAADQWQYPVISTYNGHAAGVGNVATTSTFHHFFDINLIGDKDCWLSDPRHLGFLASPNGTAFLHNSLDQFYRNLVYWLLRPKAKLHLVLAALQLTRSSRHAAEAISPVSDPAELHFLTFGRLAVNTLSRLRVPTSVSADAVLCALEYPVLPPWFQGDPGDRQICDTRSLNQLRLLALGGGIAELHGTSAPRMLQMQADTEQLEGNVLTGLNRGLHLWRSLNNTTAPATN